MWLLGLALALPAARIPGHRGLNLREDLGSWRQQGLPPSHFSDGALGRKPRLFPELRNALHLSAPEPGSFVSAAPHLRAAVADVSELGRRAAAAPAGWSRAPALRGLTRLAPACAPARRAQRPFILCDWGAGELGWKSPPFPKPESESV